MQRSFLSKDRHPMYDIFQPDIGYVASGPPFHIACLALLHGTQMCKSFGSSFLSRDYMLVIAAAIATAPRRALRRGLSILGIYT